MFKTVKILYILLSGYNLLLESYCYLQFAALEANHCFSPDNVLNKFTLAILIKQERLILWIFWLFQLFLINIDNTLFLFIQILIKITFQKLYAFHIGNLNDGSMILFSESFDQELRIRWEDEFVLKHVVRIELGIFLSKAVNLQLNLNYKGRYFLFMLLFLLRLVEKAVVLVQNKRANFTFLNEITLKIMG